MILVSWSFGRSLRLFKGTKKKLAACTRLQAILTGGVHLVEHLQIDRPKAQGRSGETPVQWLHGWEGNTKETSQMGLLLSNVFERDGFINYLVPHRHGSRCLDIVVHSQMSFLNRGTVRSVLSIVELHRFAVCISLMNLELLHIRNKCGLLHFILNPWSFLHLFLCRFI